MSSERRGQKPTNGWVYVVSNPAWPGYSKVGHARRLERRLGSYNTSSPFRDFVVEYAVYTADRLSLEREVHDRLNGLRVDGEWFRIHPEDAQQILSQAFKDALDE